MNSQITNKFQLKFFEFDHGFCESKFFSGHPEYLNVISSLLMLLLTIGKTDNLIFCLRINGISSMLYHYYGTIGFGIIDRASMISVAISAYDFLLINNKLSKVHILLMIVSLSLHNETLFNNMFGIFLFVMYYYTRKFTNGGKILLFSAVIWMISELYICNIYTFYFHFFWHILCGFSVRIIINDYHKFLLKNNFVDINNFTV